MSLHWMTLWDAIIPPSYTKFYCQKNVYLVSKQDSSELFEKFEDQDKFFICSHVIELWFWKSLTENEIIYCFE